MRPGHNPRMNHELTIYCGDEGSGQRLMADISAARTLAMSPEARPPEPLRFAKLGNVAVVGIKGSLINGYAGYMGYYGYTGYGDVKAAVAQALSDETVSSILLDVDSGGGQVAGVHDLSKFLSKANKVKPLVTYTGGTMASAALWSGSSSKKIVASESAMVGSLGILVMHVDRTEQLAKEGLKVEVIRAGTHKALSNPYEKLSKTARAEMEDQAQAFYDLFLGHVAEQRGLNTEVADEKFGQGRVFVGQQAVDAGLVDKLGSFEDALAEAVKLGDASNKRNTRTQAGQTPRQSLPGGHNAAIETTPTSPMPTELSPEALAAAEAGVDLEPVTAQVDPQVATLQAEVDQLKADLGAAQASAESAVAASAQALAAVQAELATAKEAQAAAEAQTSASIDIARASVRTMGLHFGVTAEAVQAMTVAQVLETHADLSAKFKSKFKTVSTPAATVVPTQPAASKMQSPLFAVLLQAQNR